MKCACFVSAIGVSLRIVLAHLYGQVKTIRKRFAWTEISFTTEEKFPLSNAKRTGVDWAWNGPYCQGLKYWARRGYCLSFRSRLFTSQRKGSMKENDRAVGAAISFSLYFFLFLFCFVFCNIKPFNWIHFCAFFKPWLSVGEAPSWIVIPNGLGTTSRWYHFHQARVYCSHYLHLIPWREMPYHYLCANLEKKMYSPSYELLVRACLYTTTGFFSLFMDLDTVCVCCEWPKKCPFSFMTLS